jgi:predicted enzyme related to lactoylglutathione lyase
MTADLGRCIVFLRLELFVDDIERAVSFYRAALGFDVERQEHAYVALRNGDAVLGIGRWIDLPPSHHFNPEIGTGRLGIGAEIVLEVDDVHTALERAKAAGAKILTPLRTRSWGATDFRLADPDGYYLRVTSPATASGS